MSSTQQTIADLEPGNVSGELFFKNHIMSWRAQGSHLSLFQQVSKLPESSRSYAPGDSINRIDWKAYARSDQLIVRQRRVEAGARVAIAVDLSDSMIWPTAETFEHLNRESDRVVSKIEIAMRVSFDIAYQLSYFGDMVDFMICREDKNGDSSWYRRKFRGAGEVGLYFSECHKKKFAPDEITSHFEPVLTPEMSTYHLAIGVGDGLGSMDLLKFWGQARQRVFCHTLSSWELQCDWLKRDFCYFDENQKLLEFQGNVLTGDHFYERTIHSWLKEKYDLVAEHQGLYLRVTQKTPVNEFYKALCTGAHLIHEA